jgi:hypothetical protein
LQIVLSGNRVIAYGDNCFLAMGGTVICEETGKAFQNATIAEVETLPADIGRVGYEYHAGIFVPCAPYGMDNGNGTILVACDECGTPKDSGLRIDEIIGAKLYVTAPAGCEVICTNGDKTVKGVYKNSVYVCNLTDYGEWTVTVGRWHGVVYESSSNTVTVDIAKPYALTLGATISVEYPEGATVTCTHDDVVLTAPDKSGVWEFEVLAFGEWEFYCTNGADETSRKFTVSTGGQTETIKLAYFAAYIVATFPGNSVCTCADGSTTLSCTNVGSDPIEFTFTVPNPGIWTVKATSNLDPDKTKQTEVTIGEGDEGKSKSVTLLYRYYYFTEGKGTTEEITIVGEEDEFGVTVSASSIYAYFYYGTSGAVNGGWYTKKLIDLSKFDYLYFDVKVTDAWANEEPIVGVLRTQPTYIADSGSGNYYAYQKPSTGVLTTVSVPLINPDTGERTISSGYIGASGCGNWYVYNIYAE